MSKIDTEVDEAVAKLKASHKFYQEKMLAASDAAKATTAALVSVQETNARLVQTMATMCKEIREDLQVVMKELATQKKRTPSQQSPMGMQIMRDKDGKMSGVVTY